MIKVQFQEFFQETPIVKLKEGYKERWKISIILIKIFPYYILNITYSHKHFCYNSCTCSLLTIYIYIYHLKYNRWINIIYPRIFTDSLEHLFMEYYHLSISIDQIFYILFSVKFEGSASLCVIILLYYHYSEWQLLYLQKESFDVRTKFNVCTTANNFYQYFGN